MRLKISSLILFVEKFTEVLQEKGGIERFIGSARKRRKSIRKRYRLTGLLLAAGFSYAVSQPVIYDNFEGSKLVQYNEKSGVLDTTAKNPAVDKVNSSPKCAMYIRNSSKKFDNIKMKLRANLVDVKEYATYLGVPPKIKMKIYTSAPAGTLVEILLGSRRGNNDYPGGTNSQYQAYTTVSNAWEELEFKFSQIPQGSETSTTQVDQVVLLFNPNSSTSDTYYFDDITGPALVPWPAEKITGPEEVIKKPVEVKKSKTGKKITKK